MDTYFTKFPIINYNKQRVRNITERVSLTPEVRKIPMLFYPYELKSEMRSDVVSYHYYDTPTLDWMIYLANGITDPYFDWYLYQDDFYAFLKKKYGSIENAQEKIAFYRTNWANDVANISVAAYAAKPDVIRKYYTPVFGAGAKIMSYSRRQEDWISNTNKIIQLNFASASNTYIVDEIVDIKNGGVVVGGGTVVASNTSSVTIQHTSGYQNTTYTCIGETSNAQATITGRTVLKDVISDDEFVFWSPVTYYDLEEERNEQNKFIHIIEKNKAPEISDKIRLQLKNE